MIPEPARTLIRPFADAFTRPTFARFVTLMAAAIPATGRRTASDLRRDVAVVTGTGHRYESGEKLVPVRWVFVRDRTGTHRDDDLFSTDVAMGPRAVIEGFTARWSIELLSRVLKSGRRVEDRRFEDLERLLPCLAVYLIVARRVLFRRRSGRGCPEMSGEAVLEPPEWKSVYVVVRREPPPEVAPRLQEMIRLVAQLGGYVDRKREDEPGPRTLWLGLQRLHDIATCWKVFGPGAREEEAAVGMAGELVSNNEGGRPGLSPIAPFGGGDGSRYRR